MATATFIFRGGAGAMAVSRAVPLPIPLHSPCRDAQQVRYLLLEERRHPEA